MATTPPTSFRNRNAFTLIELLIVVAIIAILAAIAVPNFLEAQTRAKVSRVKSDFRTLKTAIEAYAVDYNRPPNHSWGTAVPGFNGTADMYNGEPYWGCFTRRITTPTAYISKFDYFDPFVETRRDVQIGLRLYSYERFRAYDDLRQSSTPPGGRFSTSYTVAQTNAMRRDMGEYAIESVGPSGGASSMSLTNSSAPYWWYTQYDPTNGSISYGLIIVSQNYSDIVQRPY